MCRNIFRTFSSSHPTDLGHIARTYREGIREGSFWHLRPHSDLRVSNRGLPKTGTLKINPKSVAYLSSLKMWLLNHHIHHASHHKLTTKTPRFGTRFCQNPQQKRVSTTFQKITATTCLLQAVSWPLPAELRRRQPPYPAYPGRAASPPACSGQPPGSTWYQCG